MHVCIHVIPPLRSYFDDFPCPYLTYFALSTRNLAAGTADNSAHSKEASPSCSGRWNANECESDRLDELHQGPLMSGVA